MVPSQGINENKHKLWIPFSKSRDVKTAYYDCASVMCNFYNHIVAILCKTEYANQKVLTSPTCTVELCSWSTSTKELKSMNIRDMNIQEHNQENENKQHTINSTQKIVLDLRLEFDRNKNKTVAQKEQFLARIRDKLPKAVLKISVTPPSSHDA